MLEVYLERTTTSAKDLLAAYRWVYLCVYFIYIFIFEKETSQQFSLLHQGVRMGETATNVANVNMAQGLKIRVEDGCDLADPCDSNICPENSHCSDDWSTHTCVCDPGSIHLHKAIHYNGPCKLLYIAECGLSITPHSLLCVLQVILVRSVWMLATSTLVSMFPPAFGSQVLHTATLVNADRTTMASTVKTSKVPSSVGVCAE